MILVTLGTQDKDFSRLLKVVEKAVRDGLIDEKVIVQAGHTKYQSDVLEVVDLISPSELEALIKDASLVITHGGVGSIITALKYQKKIIAAARLKKYREHTNDHQEQIIKKFAAEGYLLELRDFNSFSKVLKKATSFKVKPYNFKESHMEELIDAKVEEWESTGVLMKGKKFRELFLYLIFGALTTVINILVYFLLARLLTINYQVSTVIAWLLSVLFAYGTNKLFVFESKNQSRREDFREIISFFAFRILSLGIDMGSMYVMVQLFRIDDLIAKIVANIIVVIANYVFSKLFIFKK